MTDLREVWRGVTLTRDGRSWLAGLCAARGALDWSREQLFGQTAVPSCGELADSLRAAGLPDLAQEVEWWAIGSARLRDVDLDGPVVVHPDQGSLL